MPTSPSSRVQALIDIVLHLRYHHKLEPSIVIKHLEGGTGDKKKATNDYQNFMQERSASRFNDIRVCVKDYIMRRKIAIPDWFGGPVRYIYGNEIPCGGSKAEFLGQYIIDKDIDSDQLKLVSSFYSGMYNVVRYAARPTDSTKDGRSIAALASGVPASVTRYISDAVRNSGQVPIVDAGGVMPAPALSQILTEARDVCLGRVVRSALLIHPFDDRQTALPTFTILYKPGNAEPQQIAGAIVPIRDQIYLIGQEASLYPIMIVADIQFNPVREINGIVFRRHDLLSIPLASRVMCIRNDKTSLEAEMDKVGTFIETHENVSELLKSAANSDKLFNIGEPYSKGALKLWRGGVGDP